MPEVVEEAKEAAEPSEKLGEIKEPGGTSAKKGGAGGIEFAGGGVRVWQIWMNRTKSSYAAPGLPDKAGRKYKTKPLMYFVAAPLGSQWFGCKRSRPSAPSTPCRVAAAPSSINFCRGLAAASLGYIHNKVRS